jgi:glycyl-tRNA synthetase beta chain
MFAEELARAGLEAEAIETFATPRRLGLIARGLPLATAAVSEEIKGPRASAPPQALDGFLRKTGLTQDALVERDGVLVRGDRHAGSSRTASCMQAAIARIILTFPWPRSMRWGHGFDHHASLRLVVSPVAGQNLLPVRDEIVPVRCDVFRAGATTVGQPASSTRVRSPLAGASAITKSSAPAVIVDPASALHHPRSAQALSRRSG